MFAPCKKHFKLRQERHIMIIIKYPGLMLPGKMVRWVHAFNARVPRGMLIQPEAGT
jgi:hypothetical protein